jgi:acetylornithine deacetylase/succinyl-diaminopimelate desuccinylase-like protein
LKTRPKADAWLQAVHGTIEKDFPEHLERCRNFLRQKSISSTGEGIRETANLLRSFIERLDGQVTFWGDPNFPIILGRVDTGAPRTIIIYGMYDVQPVEESNWISPPFAAEIHCLPRHGDCIIARGAVNSKGALCGLFNALSSICKTSNIPLNLIFTLEGEEEIGSPQFEKFIHAHRHVLRGDGVVDFDFSQDSQGKVSMHLGLKGIVYLDLICKGGWNGGPVETSVHGSVNAWISSPVWRLIHALSSLTDHRERIKIPNFYENVQRPSKADIKILSKLERVIDEKSFLREMKGLCFKYPQHGMELLKKGLYLPVINVNGIRAGYYGSGTKTILPRKATAKIDIRFGPNMEPDEVINKFRAYLRDQGFGDIEVNVRDSYTWSKTDYKEPIVQKMIEAYRHHGNEPEIWPLATWAAPYFVFSRILKIPVVSGGLGHGGRQHVSNEYMTVKGLLDFEKFVATFLYFMSK